MGLTSRARPLDLVELFPGLAAFARTATRLHPRPGAPEITGSHVGGPLLWPAGEAWPTCAGPHRVEEETLASPELAARLRRSSYDRYLVAREIPGFFGVVQRDGGTYVIAHVERMETAASPLRPVVQLHAADVPDLPMPSGMDLLQVLWCPHDHHEERHQYGAAVQLRWRRATDVGEVRAAAPAPTVQAAQEYTVRPCVLHPEQVVEYPWWQELPEELGRRVRDHDDMRQHPEHLYFHLSQATGWKAGGCARWDVSELKPMVCDGCADPMELVLTIASRESAGGVWRTVEEAHLVPSPADPAWTAADEPTGVTVGRRADLRIFACLSCPGTPYLLDIQ
ncbi:hypothetical protein [Catellatospora sichuanensis]|uniref:hypothetical protein n=1 Tax=Catellatospora sichuanensis TaxID=1969805 RepID=UPI0011826817|nr:hypothetical protein [Catellatospora sichuanensis]